VKPADWFLTAAERGNPSTRIDSRHAAGTAWSAGNNVQPLIHGATYFEELEARVAAMKAGDLLLFTDWRGDPDQRLRTTGPAVASAFCAAASRGVRVAGLVWRSHLDTFAFSADENRHLGEDIEAAGGQCLLDMRVRPGGSHHMKTCVTAAATTARMRATRRRSRWPACTGSARRGMTSRRSSAAPLSATWKPSSASAGRTRRRCPAIRRTAFATCSGASR
jgi:hypothetical protein